MYFLFFHYTTDRAFGNRSNFIQKISRAHLSWLKPSEINDSQPD